MGFRRRGPPPEIAFQARYPGAAGQEPLPESGCLRTVRPGFCLLMTPMPTVNLDEDVSVAPAQVGDGVEEVRVLLRTRGRGQVAWVVPASAGALLEALAAEGMTPYDDPPGAAFHGHGAPRPASRLGEPWRGRPGSRRGAVRPVRPVRPAG